MTLDPQTKLILDQMASIDSPSFETLTPEQLRKVYVLPQGKLKPIGKVENRTIPGSDFEIPIRVYYPREMKENNPALVYFHGGGWVVGNLETHDHICRALTDLANCVTISIDYRLAPEHKFPAAVDDAFAAVQYVYNHTKEFKIDNTKIAVGGDSSGGNLATVVTHLAKDRKTIDICYQLLIYPITKLGGTATDSMSQYAEGYFLTKESLDWFFNHYLNVEEDRTNPLLSPILNKDFNGLPPALIITAEYDPLRDEGEQYAKKLLNANVDVECVRYDGTIHGFVGLAAILDIGKDALNKAGMSLRKAFDL